MTWVAEALISGLSKLEEFCPNAFFSLAMDFNAWYTISYRMVYLQQGFPQKGICSMPKSARQYMPLAGLGALAALGEAHGYDYVSPANSSYVLLTSLAILFGLVCALKAYWRPAAGFFRFRFGRKGRDQNPER